MTVLEELTVEEKEVVGELKRRMKNQMTPKMLEDESLFYRFCKARDFKIEDAEIMLRKHISWRKEFQVEKLLTDYKAPEAAEKYVPCNFTCFDKEGYLIRYIDLGNTDIKGLFSSVKKTNILKYCFLILARDEEKLKQNNKKTGKLLSKSTYIMNFKNWTFAKSTHREFLECVVQFAIIFQDNYPERINRVLFINASTYFTLAFSVVKTVLSSALLQKISIYGTDSWQKDLLAMTDADLLPAFLGGTKTDPDGNPLCASFVVQGQKIPKSYYLCNSEKKLSKAPDAERLTVTRMSKEERCFEVEEPGSYLEWEFETKTKDIGFVIYFKGQSESLPVELIPKQRIDTCYEPEKGLFRCEKPGKYVVVFDNSYSWMYPKEIYYRARIISPKDNETFYN